MEALTNFWDSSLSIWVIVLALGFSVLASVVTYFMYQLFYGSRHIGAGVHRTFLIGGPAITALFLVIQTSIPLSLGLLGALSFVRFRTPVKDPAEIGFLLLLIAASIGAATGNFLATTILFAVVFTVLGIQWLLRKRGTRLGRGHLMISVDQTSFPELESKLKSFLEQRLPGLNLETLSEMDDRVSLQYLYRKRSGLDWAAFINDLNALSGTAKVEVFIGQ